MIKQKIFLYFQKNLQNSSFGWIKVLLFPCALIFQCLVFIKNFLYDHKLILPKKSSIPVISIGNITVGGSGKTPLVIYLAKRLHNRGLKVAIISRGYRLDDVKKESMILQTNEYSHEEVGDESLLYLRRVPFCQIIVGRNKYKSLQIAEKNGADIALLDDGFQSRYLKRDFDIVLLKKSTFKRSSFDLYSTISRFLPLGPFREDLRSLKRADLIICDFKDENFEKNIHLFSKAPILFLNRVIKAIKENDRQIKDVPKKIAIFCAIADPYSFKNFLMDNHFEIVDEKFYLDHQAFDFLDLKQFALRALTKGAHALVCTEKDIVKLSNIKLSLPIYFIEMDLRIENFDDKIQDFLK